jgi:malate dehydrogenase (oxaloacetate-decarboxylating)(NADP+)
MARQCWAGRHRTARSQAGDGRQGGAVQEVRQHRRVRHRDQRDRSTKLVEIIAALEPTFGGINLEDIKAPECFAIERALRARMKIPVFHDDQHGTAIIVAAATLNALAVVGKKLDNIKLVVSGAGAAALACVDLLVDIGLPMENIWLTDLAGSSIKGARSSWIPTRRALRRPLINAP